MGNTPNRYSAPRRTAPATLTLAAISGDVSAARAAAGVAVLMAAAAALGAWLVAHGWGVAAAAVLAGVVPICIAFSVAMLLAGMWRDTLSTSQIRLLIQEHESAAAAHLIQLLPGDIEYANPSYRLQFTEGGRLLLPQELQMADADSIAVLQRLVDAAAQNHPANGDIGVVVGGVRHWFQVTVQTLPGHSGHVSWHFEDVTERVKTAQSLQQANGALSLYLDNAPVGLCVLGRRGEFLFANAAFAELAGCDGDDLTGRVAWTDLVTGGDAENRAVLTPRNGPPLDVLLFRNVVTDQRGNPVQTFVAVQPAKDLPAAPAARVEPASNDGGAPAFFNDAPIGMVLLSPDSRILQANRAFRRIYGEGDPVGEPLARMVQAEDRSVFDRAVQAAIQGEGARAPAELRLRGARDYVVQLYASRFADGEGAAGAMLYLIDTTDQKTLELQFAQAQKMQAVGQLAGGVAHDFNNLLTAIIGFCDLLLVRHGPGDQSFADIMQVKQNANRAANLVRQLLAFSRQQTLRPKVLNLTDVLVELSNLLRRLIGQTVDLQFKHERNLWAVKVDQGQFEQVIINLAVNARDAMPSGGKLMIRTENVAREAAAKLPYSVMEPEDYVLIEVLDTGTGIPTDLLGKIFEPFFTTKGIGQGTGLGLSTVYGIVKQFNGYIFPENTENGAMFRVYLPAYRGGADTDQPAEKNEETGPVADTTGRGTILLVEDEDGVRLFAKRALQNKGYKVLDADSGKAALDLLKTFEGRIDVLVSDVVMPQMDGPTLVKHVREMRRDTKVIFISGYAEDAFRKTIGSEDVAFLPKPFSLKQLAEKVKDVLTGEG